jgi:hypothetical protein
MAPARQVCRKRSCCGEARELQFGALVSGAKSGGDQQHDPSIHFDFHVGACTDAGRAKTSVNAKRSVMQLQTAILAATLIAAASYVAAAGRYLGDRLTASS